MKSVVYQITSNSNEKFVRNLNYEEHLLKPEIKSKFNYLVRQLTFTNCKQEATKILFRDRANPHDWIEFYNKPGILYLAVYYRLGAYIPRLVNHRKNEQLLGAVKSLHWHSKYIENRAHPNLDKNLFSLTEVTKILSDISRINQLNIFE